MQMTCDGDFTDLPVAGGARNGEAVARASGRAAVRFAA